MDAIVYTSNTGFTEKYAKMLGEKLFLPVYALRNAESQLAAGSEIIYMGWLMAGIIKGYKRAARRYKVSAAAGVGMGATGSQKDEVRKVNHLPEKVAAFTLQGGYDRSRLTGIHKLMMSAAEKTFVSKLEDKLERTPDEEAALDMLLHGGDYVREENLADLLRWYRNRRPVNQN